MIGWLEIWYRRQMRKPIAHGLIWAALLLNLLAWSLFSWIVWAVWHIKVG